MLPSWVLLPGVCPVEMLLSRFPDCQAHANCAAPPLLTMLLFGTNRKEPGCSSP